MNLDSERQAFESAWDKRQRADWARGGRDPDQYPIGWGLAFKLTGWEMWQARAALQAPQEPKYVPKIWAWLVDNYDRNDKLHQSVHLSPLTDNVMIDEGDEAHPLCKCEDAIQYYRICVPTKIANLEDDEIMEVARKVYGTKATFQEIDFARYIIAQARGEK